MHDEGAAGPADEAPYVKLLEGLRPLEITANEAAVVSRIARFATSTRVLEAVAAAPKWYTRWEIREALLQNPRTPESVREPIGQSIAILDLMREMDGRDLHEAERREIRDDIRSLLKALPPVDHEVVKARARALAAAPRPEREEPAAAVPGAEEAAAEAADIARAAAAATPTELRLLLADRRESVRRAAMENPGLDEAQLLEALRSSVEPDFLTEAATHPRWTFSEQVRRTVLEHPLVPRTTRGMLESTTAALLGFMRWFNEPMEPGERAVFGKDLLADVQALPAPEREYVRYRVGEGWTPFVRDVMRAIEDEFRRAQPRPVTTAWPRPAPAAPAELRRPAEPGRPAEAGVLAEPRIEPKLAPEARPVTGPAPGASFDAERHAVAARGADRPSAESTHALAMRPTEEREEIARTSAVRDELAFLLHDPDHRVFAALLDNPALGEEEIVAAARTASRERIRRLVENRRAWALMGVKLALLHNPNAPEPVQIECLNHVGSVRELMLVMHDPKVRSLEVKSKARARLIERWRAMGTDERVSAIKQSGGDLLNDVWNEAFSDERALLRLLQDRSLDEAVVLKIARSRIAPRQVLAAIGQDPSWTGIYAVRLELATNPKTPREIVAKLVPKLAPADRARLRASGHASEFVREMA